MLVFSSAISASAYVYDEEYYEEPIVEDYGNYLYIENVQDLSPYENNGKISELCLKNCFIDRNTKIFSHEKLVDVRLIDCTYEKGKYDFPDNIKILQFDGKVPENVIKGIGKVEELTFWEYEGEDMTAFSSLNDIEHFYMAESEITSLKGVEKMTSLISLDLDDVGIANINELKNLKNLKELTITGTFIEDISPIENLKLEYLDLDDNCNVKTFDPIMNIDTLETFWARNCEMSITKELVDYIAKNKIDSNINEKSLKTKEKVKALADRIVNDKMSDEEKIGTIVKYICDNMEYTLPEESEAGIYEYNQLLSKYNDNALAYALKGQGCCANYTALTFALLSQAGIDNYCVSGLDHIWNLVEIDGYYYWLDTTWIDTGYDYYLEESFWYMNSSEDFTISHEYYAIPAEVKGNPDAFGRTYVNTMSFRLEDFFVDFTEGEETTKNNSVTKAETTTVEETITEEKTTIEETTEEEKTEGTTAETEKETDNESKDKKSIVIVCVSVAALGIIAVIAIVIVKKRNKPID